MKKKCFAGKAHMALVLTMMMTLIFISSPLISAIQTEKKNILLIVGETVEEAPVSGVELEFYRQNADGSSGEKVGSFVSESGKDSVGHIRLSLEQGTYVYRVVSENYVLPEEAASAEFTVEAGDNTILVWVTSQGDVEIGDEKIAQGAPVQPEKEPSGEKAEISGKAKGEFDLSKFIFGDYGGIGVTLVVLITVILGVIGLDYRMRHHR